MKDTNLSRTILLSFVVIMIFLTSVPACSSGPENELVGDWSLNWFSSSSVNLAGNLTFGKKKSLTVTGSLDGSQEELRYAVIAPGKLKITMADGAVVADFIIEKDELIIQFDDGRNYYQRVQKVSETENESSLTLSESTNSELFPTATHIDMNQFISSSSTPVPTNTSDPLVLQQPTTTEKPDVTPTPKIYSPLPQCAASRLHVGDSAFVNYETGRVGMRSEPVARIGDKLVRKLDEGEILHIIDGPVCDMGWVFWKVRTVYSEYGWIPEGDGSEYWVVPIATYSVCPGAKPTRLRIGDRAFVEPMPVDHNRIYPEPAIDPSKLLYRMKPGSYMKVLDGPSCGSGKAGVWWYVRSEDSGIEGWTRESDYAKSYYFIAPVIPRP